MRNELEKLCKMVRSLPLTEGRNETELSCISVYLSRQRKAELPQTDSFYVYVVLDLDGDLAERIADGGLDSRVTASADAHVTASIGSQFLQSVINIQQAGEIYEINSWIKENFRDSFTVEELAEKRNMSVSQFTGDYRKMFGLKPKEDMMKLRSQVERQSRG